MDAATSKEIESLTLYTRHDAAEVVPILREIDISLVETGKYLLNFTFLNRNMKELSTQVILENKGFQDVAVDMSVQTL